MQKIFFGALTFVLLCCLISVSSVIPYNLLVNSVQNNDFVLPLFIEKFFLSSIMPFCWVSRFSVLPLLYIGALVLAFKFKPPRFQLIFLTLILPLIPILLIVGLGVVFSISCDENCILDTSHWIYRSLSGMMLTSIVSGLGLVAVFARKSHSEQYGKFVYFLTLSEVLICFQYYLLTMIGIPYSHW